MSTGFKLFLIVTGFIFLMIVAFGLYAVYVAETPREIAEAPWTGEQGIRNMGHYIDAMRERIERTDEIVGRIRKTVQKDGWLPEGTKKAKDKAAVGMVLWGEALRDSASAHFNHHDRELAWLRKLAAWSRAPDTIAETYDGEYEHDGEYDEMIRSAEKPRIAVIEVVEYRAPGEKRLEVEGAELKGEFVTGLVRFRVGVFDAATGALVAYGDGDTENSSIVFLTEDLKEDLRQATEVAARGVASRLVGK